MRRFRICMILDALDLGGAETHVVTLANQLAAMGHEVTVLSAGGRMVSALSGVRHVSLSTFKKINLPRIFFRLLLLFAKEKFDIVHAHTRLSAFLCRPLVGRRLVVSAHWVFDTRFPKKQLTTWGRETLAVSPDIAAYLMDVYGCDESRITVTVNGIDTNRFFPSKRPATRRRIVCCTRMDHDRADAAFALLEAATALPSHLFSLLLIGDGNRFDELKRRSETLLKQHPTLDIRLAGGVSDVAPYLADADIFVGVSRAALEGMASGCAVILAGNEGYLSIFEPSHAAVAEESNFCCRDTQPMTVERLTKDLLRLLRLSRAELRQMGEENRRYLLHRYTALRMAEDALSVYERICKEACVLCGYYGFGNVGDTLLARALNAQMKKCGYRCVRLLSTRHISLPALWLLFRGYDLFLGGGNLLQDGTSRRSLSFYLFCARRARRVEIYGGIGPLSKEGEIRVSHLLRRTALFHARTKEDLAYAERLGAKSVRLSADTALALPFPKKEKGERILLSFRYRGMGDDTRTVAFIKHLCDTFGKERLMLVAMHPRDKGFLKRIASGLQIEYVYADADEFLSLLSRADAVISSRLHAGICALGVGVPFLLWEGESKCRFFIEDVKTSVDGADFCDLFSFDERPLTLPDAQGIKEAKIKMRERI